MADHDMSGSDVDAQICEERHSLRGQPALQQSTTVDHGLQHVDTDPTAQMVVADPRLTQQARVFDLAG
jgi:hypothetical protein